MTLEIRSRNCFRDQMQILDAFSFTVTYLFHPFCLHSFLHKLSSSSTMASKSKPHLKLVTPQARALLHAKETSCRLTESISSSEDSGTDNDLDIDARKLKKQRKRKAKNQRRYYYR
jgi:hypothetical protein